MTGNPRNIRTFESVLRAGGLLFKKRRMFGLHVINKTGSDIAADKLVAVSGFDVTTKLPKVVLADADAANLATEVFVSISKITDGKEGNVYKGGLSTATLDTSGATTVGDPLYLSTTAGAFTSTAPTAVGSRVVIVGYSTVKSSTVGQIAWDIQDAQKLGSNDLIFGGGTIPVTASGGATRLLTLANSGSINLFDAATGIAYTLPASPTVGIYYDFYVNVLQTSGTNQIIANATPASTFLIGSVQAFSGENITPAVNVGPVIFNSPLASSFVQLRTNGTTTGGGAGSWFRFVCLSSTSWFVTGIVHTPSGTQATPFSV